MLPDENKSAPPTDDANVKIYLLPNLFTAGNLACGFFALTWMFKYNPAAQDFEPIYRAIWLILAAFAFDFFDGRVARMTRKQSPFGREFDSLADMVSFGVAPAFMVYQVVLHEFIRTGWVVAAIYLVCGGVRLARFNILSQIGAKKHSGEFTGFPIPSAAGLVVSVTLMMMSLQEHDRQLGAWRFVLPALMLALSWVMVSNVRYPTFKNVEWTLQKSLAAFALVVVAGFALAAYFEITLAFLFVAYLLYGLLRPWINKRWRREIETDEDEDESAES